MKRFGLLPRLLLAIVLGILMGRYLPAFVVQIFVTFSSLFGNFLSFVIPLIILAFVAPGIAELGAGAGRLLAVTVAIAYFSTIVSGLLAYGVATTLLPNLINTSSGAAAESPGQQALEALFQMEMPPVFPVMTALLLAFILGIGASLISGKTLLNLLEDFEDIISRLVDRVIIPLLPLHIAGIFANMSYAGEVARILAVFGRVFVIVIALHFTVLLVQFSIAGIYGNKSVVSMLRNQIPGYLTALGTQSSAATIPVNLKCAEANGVSEGIRQFVVPLCATIHLSGSTITLTSCAIAVMMLNQMPIDFTKMMGFILMLGITMVAAPGVPGGAVMAALGVLESMLGFTDAQNALMIALYLTQDSFGTACNVSGDNAIAVIVDKLAKKFEVT